jgi:hypothetical protein
MMQAASEQSEIAALLGEPLPYPSALAQRERDRDQAATTARHPPCLARSRQQHGRSNPDRAARRHRIAR